MLVATMSRLHPSGGALNTRACSHHRIEPDCNNPCSLHMTHSICNSYSKRIRVHRHDFYAGLSKSTFPAFAEAIRSRCGTGVEGMAQTGRVQNASHLELEGHGSIQRQDEQVRAGASGIGRHIFCQLLHSLHSTL